MKRLMLLTLLAGCAQGADVAGPQVPQLNTELVAEKPGDGCWHQTNLGFFEVPCEMDSAMIASLQRALTVRGLYSGQADGRMGASTRQAVKAYQEQFGLGSERLSLAGARSLGLAPVPM